MYTSRIRLDEHAPFEWAVKPPPNRFSGGCWGIGKAPAVALRAVLNRNPGILDLEGIVAKRRDGLYAPEETSWVKIKNPAYSQAEGRSELFEKRARSASA